MRTAGNPLGKSGKDPGKANLPRTLETYNTVLDAYRSIGVARHRDVSKATGMGERACRTLWFKGWPAFLWGRPIERVVAEEFENWRREGAERRARMKEVADADLERRRAALREELSQEGQLAATVREDALAAALVVRKLVPAMDTFAELVRRAVMTPDPSDPTGKRWVLNPAANVRPGEAMAIISRWALAVERIARSEVVVLELGKEGRKTLGAIGEDEAEELSNEQMADALNMAAEFRDRMLAEREGDDDPESQVH